MESCIHIAIISGGVITGLGVALSEGVLPYIIPGADGAEVRMSMRIYSIAIPFLVSIINLPTALLGAYPDKSDVPIFLREFSSGGIANLAYFFALKNLSPQSFIYTLSLHAGAGIVLGRLLLGKNGDIKLFSIFRDFKEKTSNALLILSSGFVEGFLSGADSFGWLVVTWVISQQKDPRYLLNQFAQLNFASSMIETLTSFFRREAPSIRLLLAANFLTAGIGIGLGPILSIIKGSDPSPSMFVFTLLPILGKRIITQIAMDKAPDPKLANQKMINAHLLITLLAVGTIIASHFLGVSAENIFWLYPFLTAGLGILSSGYFLAKPPAVVLPVAEPQRQEQRESSSSSGTLTSLFGLFSSCRRNRNKPVIDISVDEHDESIEVAVVPSGVGESTPPLIT